MKRLLKLIALLGTVILSLPSAFAQSQFIDVAQQYGVANTDVGSGVAWVDFNNDGMLDLYVSTPGANYVYQNNGAGFSRGPDELIDWRGSSACAWADYDNDGWLDLFIANAGENGLFHRIGEHYFDVAADLGVNEVGYQTAATWADYDNDGDVDLFVGTWGGACFLYRNDENVFTEVSAQVGITHPQNVWSAAWGDYDADNDPDLYVSGGGQNYFYRNDNGIFVEIAQMAGVAGNADEETRGCSWVDYDNDGDLDLFVVGYLSSNHLFRNDGNSFVDVAAEMGVNYNGTGNGCAWADYDLDGDQDLYVTYEDGPNTLYRNDGNLFTEVAASLGIADSLASTGCAWGDYDNDGDLDLYVVNTNGQPNRLYRNEGSGNHWLQIKLIGTYSSRDAIGTRVVVHAGGSNQLGQVEGGSGYFSQNSLPLEFGLGSLKTMDSLEIYWPSGNRDTYYSLIADQCLEIIEGRKKIGPTVLRVPEDYPDIQSALDAAFSGDTVLVNDGVYYENIVWPGTYGIFLTSVNGASSTFIDGGNQGRVLDLHFNALDSATVIDGFTIQNGMAYDGAGISVENCSPTIRNNRILNNRADALGGGLRLINSQALIHDNLIGFNVAGYGGGGIFAEKPVSQMADYPPEIPGPTIQDNSFIENNSGYLGGGIYYRAVWVRIKGNKFIENTSKYGGAIYCGSYDSKGEILNNIIFRNSAEVEGGGVFCAWYSHGILANNHILENQAGRLGGGIIYFLYSKMSIAGSEDLQNDIYHNMAGEKGDEILSMEYEPNTVQHNFWGTANITSEFSGVDGIDSSRWWPPAKLPQPITRTLTGAPDSLWFAECFLAIDSLEFTESGGTITVTTFPDSIPASLIGSTAINKFFQIETSGLKSIQSRLQFYFTEDEVSNSGIDNVKDIVCSRWNGSSWTDYETVVDTINHYATCEADPVGIWSLRSKSRTDVKGTNSKIFTYTLEQNFPNPFNSTTNITYQVMHVATVKITIYNVLGQKVKTLLSQQQPPGRYSIIWNAADLPSGLYTYTLEIRNTQDQEQVIFSQRKKALLIK